MAEKQFQGGTAPMVDDLGDGSHVPLVKVVNPSDGGHGGGGGLTDQQLRASPVPVSAAALTNLDTDVGALDAAAAPADGTGNYSVIAALKRGLLNWASLLARIPALESGRMPVTDTAASGTRAYNFAQATRTAVGATSSSAQEIGTLAASREVMLIASTRCFIRFGASTVTAANATDAALLALPADAMFHMRLPSGVTHYTIIATADGFVSIVPVL
jgi:hypothetical protein